MKRAKRSKPEIIKVGNIAVRLYKRERETASGKTRIVYEVADYTSGERRFRGFSDHAEAKREADKIARQLASGETTAATMRNADAASYGRAVEILRPTGASLELAATVYAKVFQIVGEDAIEAATFYARHRAGQVQKRKIADVVVEFVTSREARGKSAAYVNDLRQRLARFAKFTGADVTTNYTRSPEFGMTATGALAVTTDAYANEHFFAICYIKWAGTLWTVSNVDVQSPRLLLTLGGVYNGPKAPTTSYP